jgi:hypothetical protein
MTDRNSEMCYYGKLINLPKAAKYIQYVEIFRFFRKMILFCFTSNKLVKLKKQD